MREKVFLLVEDNRDDAQMVQRQFKQGPAGLRLQTVEDGIEAIRYLEGEGEYVDREKYPFPGVILLDLKMPRLSGFDFLEWLHTKSSEHLRLIPVVVMSCSVLQEDIRRAYALGVNSYIVKPNAWSEFKERIRTLGLYWAEHVETPSITLPAKAGAPSGALVR